MRMNCRPWPVVALGLSTVLLGCGGAAEPDRRELALQANAPGPVAMDDAAAQRLALDRLVASRREATRNGSPLIRTTTP